MDLDYSRVWCYRCDTLSAINDCDVRELHGQTMRFCPHCHAGPINLWPWFLSEGESNQVIHTNSDLFIRNALIKHGSQSRTLLNENERPVEAPILKFSEVI